VFVTANKQHDETVAYSVNESVFDVLRTNVCIDYKPVYAILYDPTLRGVVLHYVTLH